MTPGSILDIKTDVLVDYTNFNSIIINGGYKEFLYFIGEKTCHQMHDRSLLINNNQIPICFRCIGIYIGTSITFILSLLKKPQGTFLVSLCKLVSTNKVKILSQCNLYKIVIIGILLSSPMIIDLTLQNYTLYASNNSIRFFTGILFGGALGGCIVGILNDFIYGENPDLLRKKR